MKNIGNKMAMKLAKEKFGDKAGILRHGCYFMIVKIWHLSKRLSVTTLKGIGRSWKNALEDAGVNIPNAHSRNFTTNQMIVTPEETDELIEKSQE